MSRRLTSAKKQSDHTKAWKATRGAGEPFFAFCCPIRATSGLGIADAATPTDIYFRAGMKSAPAGARQRRDRSAADRVGRRNFHGRIDAMVLIADDDRSRLDQTIVTLTKELAPISERTFVERGDQLTFDFGGGRNKVEIEHFGHQDGISQPRLVKQDIDKEIAERGGTNWNPVAPLRWALSRSRRGGHVRQLSRVPQARTERKGIPRRRATASPPRSESTPTTPPRLPSAASATDGRCCRRPSSRRAPIRTTSASNPIRPPRAALIRRISARPIRAVISPPSFPARPTRASGRCAFCGAASPSASVRTSRPARRCHRRKPASACCSCVIRQRLRQFVIQQDGADSNDFVKTGVGPDATLGNNTTRLAQQWPPDGAPAAKSFLMTNFVTMLGGEYFFAPSPQFLASL